MTEQKELTTVARPNSAETMSQKEIEEHYKSSNFPEVRYHSSGGGGVGSVNPPKPRRR